MIDLKPLRNDEKGPGWRRDRSDESVIVVCPKNHHFLIGGRSSAHGLIDEGDAIAIKGSVICQGRPKDPCGWHEHIRLLKSS